MEKTLIDIALRSYRDESDAAVMAEIMNREWAADGVPSRESVADVAAWLRNPSEMFDAKRDVALAEVDGQVVAFADRNWVDTTDGLREYRIGGSVLPEWRHQGIGTQLLAENESRARQLAASHETDRKMVLGAWTNDRQEAAIALLKEHGYEQARWFFDMTRELSEPIPDLPLPDGLEVRPVSMDNVRQIWAADVDAFQDHWGGFDSSDASLQRWLESETFDPTLWVIAWDGDEVAGGVINAIHPEENEAVGVERAWLHSVFTRRAWRKRGLATALIARSLELIKTRGMTQGILGVDAANPSGALGLYERIGFKVAERSSAWRKPLEA
jgi:mycothiol synthase